MATPRHVHIFPNCGLEIEIDRSTFPGIDYTDSKTPWKYIVKNYGHPNNGAMADRQEHFEGWMSPAASITLPPSIRAKGGIPDEAMSYAFMYPPQGLAEALKRSQEQNCDDSDEPFGDNPNISAHQVPNTIGIESAAKVGGFAYFDKNHDCICINAFSTQRSDNKLRFSGPYEVKPSVCRELYTLSRPHPLQLDIFHEVGFVSYAWVRPRERFQFESVFANDVHMNNNGTMIFFRENGTGVAYAVDQSEFVDPTSYVGILSDAFQNIGEAKFTKQVILPIDEVKAWGTRVKHWTPSMPPVVLVDTLEDERRVIHMACHAALGHNFVSNVLLNFGEKHYLSHQDSFGWNPLHYACCFSPSDCILIKLLVTECPEAAVQLDIYNRSPLHIACNSNTSEEVVAILLKADKYIPKVTINAKTRKFGLLPIHLACFNGAQDGIINALLDADCGNNTAIQKSRSGHMPLHIVILKRLPASMVKVFLDIDSKLKKLDKSNSDSETISYEYDIYQSFDGKIPLHLACFNNSSSEIVQLLLEKDEHSTTINETVNEVFYSTQSEKNNTLGLGSRKKNVYRNKREFKGTNNGSIETCDTNCLVALHLAMRHGSKKVISLLLRKETGKKDSDWFEPCMLHKKDISGKTPLHIACQYNIDPQIIYDLLDLDPTKISTQICDVHGFMPIHYACENKNTSAETINILLDAEEKYLEAEFKNSVHKRRSTHTGDTERNRTPLFLAAKSGIEGKAFERLLAPENFLLKDFDDPTLADLAEIVKNNRAVQVKVIERLSERIYFCFLILELYACLGALISFSVCSVSYINGHLIPHLPAFLICCTVVFMLRELLQILSTGTDYISDLWSWFEMTNIGLLLTMSHYFREAPLHGNRPGEAVRNVLAITGFTVVFQLIIFLRTTILPFARFVGGLLIIMKKLIPFVVVAMLLIWAFIHAIWITGLEDEPNLYLSFRETYKDVFDFSPENLNGFEVLFSVLVIIVLLNVLIAIVGEAWESAAYKSSSLFWKYRLEKIYQLRYVLKIRERSENPFSDTSTIFDAMLHKIDNLSDVSYGGDISWTVEPYHILKVKDHYDNPHKYFYPDQAKIILHAHSLQGDLYWAKIDNNDLTFYGKISIILKWLGYLIFYSALVILGVPVFGIIWPKKVRVAMLTLGLSKSELRGNTKNSDKTKPPHEPESPSLTEQKKMK